MAELGDVGRVYYDSVAVKNGSASDEQKQRVEDFLAQSSRDTTFGYKVTNAVLALPSFIVEFATGAGAIKGIGQRALVKGAKEGVEALGKASIKNGLLAAEKEAVGILTKELAAKQAVTSVDDAMKLAMDVLQQTRKSTSPVADLALLTRRAEAAKAGRGAASELAETSVDDAVRMTVKGMKDPTNVEELATRLSDLLDKRILSKAATDAAETTVPGLRTAIASVTEYAKASREAVSGVSKLGSSWAERVLGRNMLGTFAAKATPGTSWGKMATWLADESDAGLLGSEWMALQAARRSATGPLTAEAAESIGAKLGVDLTEYVGKTASELVDAEKAIGKQFTSELGDTFKRAAFIGATAQPISQAHQVAKQLYENMTPQFNLTQDQAGEMQLQLAEEGNSFIPALLKAYGNVAIDNISESTGQYFTFLKHALGGRGASTLLKGAFVKSIADRVEKLGGTPAVQGLANYLWGSPGKPGALRRMGWDGWTAEMFEEGVGSVAKQALGIQELGLPSLDEVAATGLAFLINPMAVHGYVLDKRRTAIQKGLKDLATDVQAVRRAATGPDGREHIVDEAQVKPLVDRIREIVKNKKATSLTDADTPIFQRITNWISDKIVTSPVAAAQEEQIDAWAQEATDYRMSVLANAYPKDTLEKDEPILRWMRGALGIRIVGTEKERAKLEQFRTKETEWERAANQMLFDPSGVDDADFMAALGKYPSLGAMATPVTGNTLTVRELQPDILGQTWDRLADDAKDTWVRFVGGNISPAESDSKARDAYENLRTLVNSKDKDLQVLLAPNSILFGTEAEFTQSGTPLTPRALERNVVKDADGSIVLNEDNQPVYFVHEGASLSRTADGGYALRVNPNTHNHALVEDLTHYGLMKLADSQDTRESYATAMRMVDNITQAVQASASTNPAVQQWMLNARTPVGKEELFTKVVKALAGFTNTQSATRYRLARNDSFITDPTIVTAIADAMSRVSFNTAVRSVLAATPGEGAVVSWLSKAFSIDKLPKPTIQDTALASTTPNIKSTPTEKSTESPKPEIKPAAPEAQKTPLTKLADSAKPILTKPETKSAVPEAQQITLDAVAAHIEAGKKRVVYDAEAHTYAVDGVSVPSVTQRIQESDFGYKGPQSDEISSELGTMFHKLVEKLVNNPNYNDANVDKKTFAAAKEVATRVAKDGSVLFSEVLLWRAATTGRPAYAGTADIVAVKPDGTLALYDTKSSKYAVPRSEALRKHGLQLRAYAEALEDLGFTVSSAEVIPAEVNLLRTAVLGIGSNIPASASNADFAKVFNAPVPITIAPEAKEKPALPTPEPATINKNVMPVAKPERLPMSRTPILAQTKPETTQTESSKFAKAEESTAPLATLDIAKETAPVTQPPVTQPPAMPLTPRKFTISIGTPKQAAFAAASQIYDDVSASVAPIIRMYAEPLGIAITKTQHVFNVADIINGLPNNIDVMPARDREVVPARVALTMFMDAVQAADPATYERLLPLRESLLLTTPQVYSVDEDHPESATALTEPEGSADAGAMNSDVDERKGDPTSAYDEGQKLAELARVSGLAEFQKNIENSAELLGIRIHDNFGDRMVSTASRVTYNKDGTDDYSKAPLLLAVKDETTYTAWLADMPGDRLPVRDPGEDENDFQIRYASWLIANELKRTTRVPVPKEIENAEVWAKSTFGDSFVALGPNSAGVLHAQIKRYSFDDAVSIATAAKSRIPIIDVTVNVSPYYWSEEKSDTDRLDQDMRKGIEPGAIRENTRQSIRSELRQAVTAHLATLEGTHDQREATGSHTGLTRHTLIELILKTAVVRGADGTPVPLAENEADRIGRDELISHLWGLDLDFVASVANTKEGNALLNKMVYGKSDDNATPTVVLAGGGLDGSSFGESVLQIDTKTGLSNALTTLASPNAGYATDFRQARTTELSAYLADPQLPGTNLREQLSDVLLKWDPRDRTTLLDRLIALSGRGSYYHRAYYRRYDGKRVPAVVNENDITRTAASNNYPLMRISTITLRALGQEKPTYIDIERASASNLVSLSNNLWKDVSSTGFWQVIPQQGVRESVLAVRLPFTDRELATVSGVGQSSTAQALYSELLDTLDDSEKTWVRSFDEIQSDAERRTRDLLLDTYGSANPEQVAAATPDWVTREVVAERGFFTVIHKFFGGVSSYKDRNDFTKRAQSSTTPGSTMLTNRVPNKINMLVLDDPIIEKEVLKTLGLRGDHDYEALNGCHIFTNAYRDTFLVPGYGRRMLREEEFGKTTLTKPIISYVDPDPEIGRVLVKTAGISEDLLDPAVNKQMSKSVFEKLHEILRKHNEGRAPSDQIHILTFPSAAKKFGKGRRATPLFLAYQEGKFIQDPNVADVSDENVISIPTYAYRYVQNQHHHAESSMAPLAKQVVSLLMSRDPAGAIARDYELARNMRLEPVVKLISDVHSDDAEVRIAALRESGLITQERNPELFEALIVNKQDPRAHSVGKRLAPILAAYATKKVMRVLVNRAIYHVMHGADLGLYNGAYVRRNETTGMWDEIPANTTPRNGDRWRMSEYDGPSEYVSKKTKQVVENREAIEITENALVQMFPNIPTLGGRVEAFLNAGKNLDNVSVDFSDLRELNEEGIYVGTRFSTHEVRVRDGVVYIPGPPALNYRVPTDATYSQSFDRRRYAVRNREGRSIAVAFRNIVAAIRSGDDMDADTLQSESETRDALGRPLSGSATAEGIGNRSFRKKIYLTGQPQHNSWLHPEIDPEGLLKYVSQYKLPVSRSRGGSVYAFADERVRSLDGSRTRGVTVYALDAFSYATRYNIPLKDQTSRKVFLPIAKKILFANPKRTDTNGLDELEIHRPEGSVANDPEDLVRLHLGSILQLALDAMTYGEDGLGAINYNPSTAGIAVFLLMTDPALFTDKPYTKEQAVARLEKVIAFLTSPTMRAYKLLIDAQKAREGYSAALRRLERTYNYLKIPDVGTVVGVVMANLPTVSQQIAEAEGLAFDVRVAKAASDSVYGLAQAAQELLSIPNTFLRALYTVPYSAGELSQTKLRLQAAANVDYTGQGSFSRLDMRNMFAALHKQPVVLPKMGSILSKSLLQASDPRKPRNVAIDQIRFEAYMSGLPTSVSLGDQITQYSLYKTPVFNKISAILDTIAERLKPIYIPAYVYEQAARTVVDRAVADEYFRRYQPYRGMSAASHSNMAHLISTLPLSQTTNPWLSMLFPDVLRRTSPSFYDKNSVQATLSVTEQYRNLGVTSAAVVERVPHFEAIDFTMATVDGGAEEVDKQAVVHRALIMAMLDTHGLDKPFSAGNPIHALPAKYMNEILDAQQAVFSRWSTDTDDSATQADLEILPVLAAANSFLPLTGVPDSVVAGNLASAAGELASVRSTFEELEDYNPSAGGIGTPHLGEIQYDMYQAGQQLQTAGHRFIDRLDELQKTMSDKLKSANRPGDESDSTFVAKIITTAMEPGLTDKDKILGGTLRNIRPYDGGREPLTIEELTKGIAPEYTTTLGEAKQLLGADLTAAVDLVNKATQYAIDKANGLLSAFTDRPQFGEWNKNYIYKRYRNLESIADAQPSTVSKTDMLSNLINETRKLPYSEFMAKNPTAVPVTFEANRWLDRLYVDIIRVASTQTSLLVATMTTDINGRSIVIPELGSDAAKLRRVSQIDKTTGEAMDSVSVETFFPESVARVALHHLDFVLRTYGERLGKQHSVTTLGQLQQIATAEGRATMNPVATLTSLVSLNRNALEALGYTTLQKEGSHFRGVTNWLVLEFPDGKNMPATRDKDLKNYMLMLDGYQYSWYIPGFNLDIARGLSRFNNRLKHIGLSFSLFHMFSLTESDLSVAGNRRDVLNYLPWRLKKVLKTRSEEFQKAMAGDPDDELGKDREGMAWWVGKGLGVSARTNPEMHTENSIQADIEHLQSTVFGKIPGVSRSLKLAKGYFNFTDKWLWHRMLPAMKLYQANEIYAARLENFREYNNRDMTDREKRKLSKDIAHYLNTAYGGLDMRRYAWATPKVLQVWRMYFFAFDWTLSALQVGGAGSAPVLGRILRERPGPVQQAELVEHYWPAMLLWVMSVIPAIWQASIYAIWGDPEKGDVPLPIMNENDKTGYGGVAGHIDVTPFMRSVTGWEGDRTGQRRVYMRWAKQSTEVFEGWLNETVKTFWGKSSQLVKIAWEQALGQTTSGWKLDFKDVPFWDSWVTGKNKGFAGSRIASLAEKIVPMSALTLAKGQPVSFIAPMSQGVGERKAEEALASVLKTYADAASWKDIVEQGGPTATNRLRALAPEIMEAAKRNGWSPEGILTNAMRAVATPYYAKFFQAVNSGNFDAAHKAAAPLIRLNVTAKRAINSVKTRNKAAGKETTPEQELAIAAAFRATP